MAEHVHDGRGGHLRIGPLTREGVTLQIKTQGEADAHEYEAWMGPVDPEAVIAAIRVAAGLAEPKEETGDCPGETIRALADQLDTTGGATVDFEEDPEKLRGKYVHTTPATAEEPRVWAGADEPIIDQLIGSVADARAKADAAYMVADSALREASESQEQVFAHQHLSEHWDRRLEVVQRAMGMIPAPGKRGGLAAAFAGEEIEQTDRIEKALKIARFAADEDRDIPGVDR